MATTIAEGDAAIPDDRPAPQAVRPPPGNPRFPLLDSVRAVAALAIVVTHVALLTGWSFKATGAFPARLNSGVTLFFVLSGFLLYRPFVAARLDERAPPRIGPYARRRALRIIPAYWLALTLLTIWPGLPGDVFGEPWRYYLFLQWLNPYSLVSGITPAWSLCVEVMFYITLPFYALGAGRLLRGRDRDRQVHVELVILALLAAASVTARQIVHADAPRSVFQSTFPAFLYWFALGMGLAVCSAWLAPRTADRQPRPVRIVTRRPWIAWALAALSFWVVATRLGLPRGFEHGYTQSQWLGEHVLYGLTAFLFVLPAVFGDHAGGWPRSLLANRLLAWLGLVSYGIFLWHRAVLDLLLRPSVLGGAPFETVVVLAATIVVTTVIAAASYYLLERPLLRFKDGWPRSGRTGSAAASPPPGRHRAT